MYYIWSVLNKQNLRGLKMQTQYIVFTLKIRGLKMQTQYIVFTLKMRGLKMQFT